MMVELSLRHHMEHDHGTVMPHTQGVDVGRGVPETYMVSFPWLLKSMVCPLDEFPTREHNPGRIRENFMDRHWKGK